MNVSEGTEGGKGVMAEIDLDLTDDQKRAVLALKRVAKRWPKGIWLFCTADGIEVMRCGPDGEHVMAHGGGVDRDYYVDSINGIDHDGGDW